MEATSRSAAPISDWVKSFLIESAKREASDVHWVPGHPPIVRIHGQLQPAHSAALTAAHVDAVIRMILPERILANLDANKNVDCSFAIDEGARTYRYRANVFRALGEWNACLRLVPGEIPSFEWMGFPRELGERLISYPNGLVIITGVTGSGKTTTLAALVRLINEAGGRRVITVEEPVEYVYPPVSSTVITQREVGRDVDSFCEGLRSGLRQDPDVILVGEIRDPETARMALSAAETGHLILSTLHTKDAKGAVTRLTDLFPHDAQDDVRTQLSLSLRSVVSQHLLPSCVPGEKRALAMEIMHVNQPVRIAIKFGKIESIESSLQSGARDGMVAFDDDLRRLQAEGRISTETALRFAKDPGRLRS